MTSTTMPGARQAALLLHAMSASDREWALAQLDPGARVELQGLLDELGELSIPADSTLLEEAIRSVPAPPVRATVAGGVDERIAELDSLNESALASLVETLRGEPPRVVAALLAVHDWRWRERFLDALGRERRRQVEAAAADVSARPGKAMMDAILTAVAARKPSPRCPGPTTASRGRTSVRGLLLGLADRWRAYKGSGQ